MPPRVTGLVLGGHNSPTAPAARGSLSRRAGRAAPRCRAVLPNLGDRGGRQDPAGTQRVQTRRGGGTAPSDGVSPKTVPQGRPRQVRLSRRGGRQGPGDQGHRHGLGGRRHRGRPWDRLCQRSRGGRVGPGYPEGGQGTISTNRSGFSIFITRIPAPLGPPGWILDPPSDPGDPPSDPSCPQTHIRARWSHAAGGAGESSGSLGRRGEKSAQALPPQHPPPKSTPSYSQGGPEHPGLLWDQLHQLDPAERKKTG